MKNIKSFKRFESALSTQDNFSEDEKIIIIKYYRGRIFDAVRGTDLYNKYRGATIPPDDASNFNLLIQGILESGIDVKVSLEFLKRKLDKYKKTPISTEFDPSTGEFKGFIDEEEKQQAIRYTENEIPVLKKFVDYFLQLNKDK